MRDQNNSFSSPGVSVVIEENASLMQASAVCVEYPIYGDLLDVHYISHHENSRGEIILTWVRRLADFRSGYKAGLASHLKIF